jgi:hypothetical protein
MVRETNADLQRLVKYVATGGASFKLIDEQSGRRVFHDSL